MPSHASSGCGNPGGVPQTQKLAMKDLKADADQTSKQAEVHGLFVVQRMRSDSGLNTVEQLPSEYMWDVVESFEKRLHEYAQARILRSVVWAFIFETAD